MKLRNKKTGEILESARSSAVIKDKFRIYDELNDKYYTYDSLAELNAEWEDYEDPKEYWYVYGNQALNNKCDDIMEDSFKEIGNYFETKEEAEKAVEKLKAWKRLKDYNVKFNLDFVKNKIDFTYTINKPLLGVLDGEEQIFNNMKIVFGGEE